MTRPFEGIRIIDITHVLAGPFAAYQLAVLGADVIKSNTRTIPTKAAAAAPTARSTARRWAPLF
jgi:crotonobetainyl-CoA:carnitine CoA-transferase CaiB-like acyl-CoA transferase